MSETQKKTKINVLIWVFSTEKCLFIVNVLVFYITSLKKSNNLLIRFVSFTPMQHTPIPHFYSMQKICTGIVACIWCHLKKKKIPDSNSADFILRDMLKVFKVSEEVCHSAVAVCGAQQHCILTIFPVFDFQLLCDIVSVFHWPVVLKTIRHPKVKSGSFSLRWSVKMAFHLRQMVLCLTPREKCSKEFETCKRDEMQICVTLKISHCFWIFWCFDDEKMMSVECCKVNMRF